MKLAVPIALALSGWAHASAGESHADAKLDYSQLIKLDAEALAEGGIGEAYDALLPTLSKYVAHPAKVEELEDSDVPSYSVRSGLRTYAIYAPNLDDSHGQAWARATHAFFAIVNGQLVDSDYRFYAINGGNDLGGLFMTPKQAESARGALPRKDDWPYVPTLLPPNYGFPGKAIP